MLTSFVKCVHIKVGIITIRGSFLLCILFLVFLSFYVAKKRQDGLFITGIPQYLQLIKEYGWLKISYK